MACLAFGDPWKANPALDPQNPALDWISVQQQSPSSHSRAKKSRKLLKINLFFYFSFTFRPHLSCPALKYQKDTLPLVLLLLHSITLSPNEEIMMKLEWILEFFFNCNEESTPKLKEIRAGKANSQCPSNEAGGALLTPQSHMCSPIWNPSPKGNQSWGWIKTSSPEAPVTLPEPKGRGRVWGGAEMGESPFLFHPVQHTAAAPGFEHSGAQRGQVIPGRELSLRDGPRNKENKKYKE